jgi:hypothetical protein
VGHARTEGTSDNRLVSVDEFRRITGYPRDPLYAALRSGECPSIRSGNRFYIPLAAGLDFLAHSAAAQGGR